MMTQTQQNGPKKAKYGQNAIFRVIFPIDSRPATIGHGSDCRSNQDQMARVLSYGPGMCALVRILMAETHFEDSKLFCWSPAFHSISNFENRTNGSEVSPSCDLKRCSPPWAGHSWFWQLTVRQLTVDSWQLILWKGHSSHHLQVLQEHWWHKLTDGARRPCVKPPLTPYPSPPLPSPSHSISAKC